MDLDNEDDNPWEGILSPTTFAIWSKVHTSTQHIPSQLIFGWDAILNINQEANWQFIKQRKQGLIRKKIAVDNLICITLETKSY